MVKKKATKQTQRIPKSFSYDEYLKFFYPNKLAKAKSANKGDSHILARKLTEEALKKIQAKLQNK